MHWYRTPNGGRRLWIEDAEFDALAEEELRRAGLYPMPCRPAVDIERFIQRHQKADMDQHADLGPGVAGAIEFLPDRFKIFVSRLLTDQVDGDDCEPGVRGRWRATMAHEAAHGLLHRELFYTDPGQCTLANLLFDDPPEDSQWITCLGQEIVFGGGQDWREYQANRGMAALLMPRTLFITVVRDVLSEIAPGRQPILPQSREYMALKRQVSRRFEVSCQATSIRMTELEGTLSLAQPRLVANSRD